MPIADIQPGNYNVDYFSGSQVSLYIGDVWVDEVTSISYQTSQSRKPLYGYADQLFRDVTKGQFLVQGEFTINFKEAGYLFLVLDRYQNIMNGKDSVLFGSINKTPFGSSSLIQRETIESVINNDGTLTVFERNKIFQELAAGMDPDEIGGLDNINTVTRESELSRSSASLQGFSEIARSQGRIAGAENRFEAFEDAIWKTPDKLESDSRRADDPRLNPFDIYLAFGDFAGDNSVNHTIQKLTGVHILGQTKQIVIDGQPIQEAYSFIARNLV